MNALSRQGNGGRVVPANRVDAWFNQAFRDMDRLLGGVASEVTPMFAWSGMPLALWADEDRLHIEAEVPGVSLEEIEATVHEDKLFLSFERKAEEGRHYLHNSRIYGKVERVVALPEPVDVEAIEATLKDGVLRLTLPKSAEARPRKIALQAS